MEQQKKNIDFFALIGKSIKQIRQYKVILLVGLLLVIFGGAAGNNSFSFNYNLNSSSSNNSYSKEDISNHLENSSFYKENTTEIDNFISAVENAPQQVWFVPMILLAILLFFLYFLVGIYVRNMCRIALIKFSQYAKEEKPISFKGLWSEGTNYFWKVFGTTVLYVVISFLLGLFSIFLFIITCCLWIFPYIIITVLMELAYKTTLRNIVIKDLPISDSLNGSVNIISKNKSNIPMYFLTQIVISLVCTLIGVVVLILVAVPLGLLAYLCILAHLYILILPLAIIFILSSIIISTLWTTFDYVYNNNVYYELIGE